MLVVILSSSRWVQNNLYTILNAFILFLNNFTIIFFNLFFNVDMRVFVMKFYFYFVGIMLLTLVIFVCSDIFLQGVHSKHKLILITLYQVLKQKVHPFSFIFMKTHVYTLLAVCAKNISIN
jgi:hypothetical protein